MQLSEECFLHIGTNYRARVKKLKISKLKKSAKVRLRKSPIFPPNTKAMVRMAIVEQVQSAGAIERTNLRKRVKEWLMKKDIPFSSQYFCRGLETLLLDKIIETHYLWDDGKRSPVRYRIRK